MRSCPVCYIIPDMSEAEARPIVQALVNMGAKFVPKPVADDRERAIRTLELAIYEAEASVGRTDKYMLFNNTLERVKEALLALRD